MLIAFGSFLMLRYQKEKAWLPAFCGTSIAWNAWVLVLTEVLSLAGALRLVPLALCWGILDVLLLWLVARRRAWQDITGRMPERRPMVWALFALFAVICGMAVLTVSYNWDAMTYHLPRVAHWAQAGSVAHFATNCVRQISSPVLAEYIMLHLYVLCGKNDVLLNLVQALSAGGCALLCWGIAEKLELKKHWCALAALLFLATPIVFSEALTTEADIYSTLWLLLFTALLLDFVKAEHLKAEKNTLKNVALLGITVGLGYTAKPSVCIGMVVLCLWMAVVRLAKRDHFWELCKLALCALPAVVLPLLPGALRNLHSFGALQSGSVSEDLMVGTHEVRFLVANLVKHVCYNLSNGYIPGFGGLLNRIVLDAGWILGLNMNDDTITLAGVEFNAPSAFVFGNDCAPNPLLMALMLAAGLWCVIRLFRGFTLRRQYTLISLVAFCAMGMTLRWQFWGTRLLMPFFALCIPAVAAQAADFGTTVLKQKEKILVGVLAALCCLDLCVMVGTYHAARLNLGRPAGYFAADNCIYHADSYEAACDLIFAQNAKNIGLYTGNDSYEYPLWAMLGSRVERMEHVFAGEDLAGADFVPDLIFSVDRDAKKGFTRNGVTYRVLWQAEDGVAIWTPEV